MIHPGEYPVSFFDKPAAGLRNPHFTFRAIEQTGSQFLFELPDLLAQWRLTDVQANRGTSEVQFFRKGNQILQMPQFHFFPQAGAPR
jgi:hypothetical protein